MKKLLLITYSILLTTFASFAQPWGQLKQGEMTIGGTGDDRAYSMVQTKDGGYVMTGSTGSDMYVVKIDYTGYSPWNKIIKRCKGTSIVQTKDGGYAITGTSDSVVSSMEGPPVPVVKLDSLGNLQWSVLLTIKDYINEYGYSIIQTKDGGYVISEVISSSSAMSIPVAQIIKLDAKGNEKWSTGFSGLFLSADYVYSLTQTKDGGIIGLGYSRNSDVFKLDSSGNIVWIRKISVGVGKSIISTKDNGFAVVGNIRYADSTTGKGINDIYLLKLDSVGHMKWSRTIGGAGDDEGESVAQTKDGGYAVAGYTSSFGAGGYDMYVVKVDTAGNLKWTKTIGGTGNDYGNSIVPTTDGGMAIAGFTGSYGSGGNDMYFVKLDSTGGLCSATGTGGKVVSIDSGFVADSTLSDSPYIGWVDSNVTYLETNGAKVTNMCSVVSVNNILILENSIVVSPNPSNGKFTLQSSVVSSQCTVEVYNVLGEKVYDEVLRLAQDDYEIDLSGQSAGIYFYRVLNMGRFVGSGKLIIEK